MRKKRHKRNNAQTHLKKIIGFFLIFTLIASSVILPYPEKAHAATTTIRQEINIIDAVVSASGDHSAIIQLDTTKYTNATYYFETVASVSAGTLTVALERFGTGTQDATISVTATSPTRQRSTAFTPPAAAQTEYNINLSGGTTPQVKAARIIIIQSADPIASTQSQIEIGNEETGKNDTTTQPLANPKYWRYMSGNWDGSPTMYAEVSYKLAGTFTASSTLYSASATTTTTHFSYKGSPGVVYVQVEAWGGGGGGDGATSAATLGGGGGGGGAYSRATTSITYGSTAILGVGRGGAEGVNSGATAPASSTFTGVTGYIVRAAPGSGATSGTGAAGGVITSPSTIGSVVFAGGNGGAGETTVDTGGGGGGSAGPAGNGVSALGASNGVPSAGGNGNNNAGGAGGAAGTGADDTCDTENGKAGVDNVLGAGGGGGGDGDVTSLCTGGAGGKPGGGGGGSDEGVGTTLVHIGGPGQLKLTETIGSIGIALEEDDGSFANWTFKTQIVNQGTATATPDRVRSAAFTPTSGRHYRLVASTSAAASTFDIYNAKIIIDQTSPSKLESQYLLANTGSFGGSTGLKDFDTQFDPSEWANTTNLYLHELNGVSGGTGDAKLQTDPNGTPADITGSTVTNVLFLTNSTSTMPTATSTVDVNVTGTGTLNASRIIVQVTGPTTPATMSSNASKTYTVNGAVSSSSPFTITDTGATINTTNDIRIRIPTSPTFNMIWENNDTNIIVSPTLNDYTSTYLTNDVPTITADLSSVTYNEITGTLFFVINGTPTVYEFDIGGTLIRTINMTGFTDTEGIDWMYGTTYAVVQEQTAAPYLVIFDMDQSTTSISRTTVGNTTLTPNITITNNLGMEGVSYNAAENSFFVAVEKQAGGGNGGRVFEVDINGNATELTALGTALSAAGITDLSDIFYDPISEHLFILSHENTDLIEATQDGTILRSINTDASFTQPEGATFSEDGDDLFIVGEIDDYERRIRSAKVATTTVTYEDANKTAVIDVITNFDSDDYITIGGLSFKNFTATSDADNLELETDNAGTVADYDDKTVTITAPPTTPINIASAGSQTFTIGQASTLASPITVSDDSGTASITLANDIRIAIATTSGFGMEWDTSITTPAFGGSASGKVGATVSYPSTSEMLIDVTTSFGAGDTLTISGVKYQNFTAPTKSGTGALLLHTDGSATPNAAAATSSQIVTIGRGKQGRVNIPDNYLTAVKGLIGYWTMDGKDLHQNVYDSSGNGHHGNLRDAAAGEGATTTAPGRIGQALRLNGSSDHVNLGTSVLGLGGPPTGEFSISVWFKRNGTGDTASTGNGGVVAEPLVAKGVGQAETKTENANYFLGIRAGNRIVADFENRAGGGNHPVVGTTTILNNEWNHAVLVYATSSDPSSMNFRIYVNGQFDTASSTGGAVPEWESIQGLGFGVTLNTSQTRDGFFNGDLDEIRMYDRALTDGEVSLLYKLGQAKVSVTPTGRPKPGLIGHWTFDGKNIGQNIQDISNRNNHGLLQLGAGGNTATTTGPGKVGQALEFDGTDDYIIIPQTAALEPGNISVSAWFKSRSFALPQAVVQKAFADTWESPFVSWMMRVNNANLIETDVGDGISYSQNSVNLTEALIPNNWYHLMMTYDGTNLFTYLNGALVDGDTIISGNIAYGNTPTLIGADESSTPAGEYFNGWIDDVRIYDYPVPASEVHNIFKSGSVRVRN